MGLVIRLLSRTKTASISIRTGTLAPARNHADEIVAAQGFEGVPEGRCI